MNDSPARSWGTVTVLTFATREGKRAAMDALSDLIDATDDVPGLERCWLLDTGAAEAVLTTVYSSEQAATRAGAAVRPHLGTALGPYVTGPPRRWAGPVVASWCSGRDASGASAK